MSEKMLDIVVMGFKDPEEADRVLSKLRRLPREYLANEDVVVVVRDETGYVHIKQGVDLRRAGARDGFLTGGLWGTFVGLLLLHPFVGFAVGSSIGASTGALVGSLTDYGIEDDFVRSLAETFPNNSSGLFLLFHESVPERVLAELSGVKGKVLRTSLTSEEEKRLQEVLSKSNV